MTYNGFRKREILKCENKKRFKNMKVATGEIDRIRATSGNRKYLRAYRCPWCKGSHLTTKRNQSEKQEEK